MWWNRVCINLSYFARYLNLTWVPLLCKLPLFDTINISPFHHSESDLLTRFCVSFGCIAFQSSYDYFSVYCNYLLLTANGAFCSIQLENLVRLLNRWDSMINQMDRALEERMRLSVSEWIYTISNHTHVSLVMHAIISKCSCWTIPLVFNLNLILFGFYFDFGILWFICNLKMTTVLEDNKHYY